MNVKVGVSPQPETDGIFCRRVDRVWIDNQVNPNRPHNGALYPQDSWSIEITTAQGTQATINHPATGGGTWGPNVVQLGQLIEQATGIPYVGLNTGIGDDDDNTTPFFGSAVADICPGDDYVVSAIATTVGGPRDGRVIQLAVGVIEGDLEVWTVDKTKSGVEWCDTSTGNMQTMQPDCIFKGTPPQYFFPEPTCPTTVLGPHCWIDGDPAAVVQTDVFAEADCNNKLNFFYFPAGDDPEPWEAANGFWGDCDTLAPVDPPVADEECTLTDLSGECGEVQECTEIGSITGTNNGLGISGSGTSGHKIKHATGSQATTDQIAAWIDAGYVVVIEFASGPTAVVDTKCFFSATSQTFTASADHTQADPCNLYSQAVDGSGVLNEAVTYTAYSVADEVVEPTKVLNTKITCQDGPLQVTIVDQEPEKQIQTNYLIFCDDVNGDNSNIVQYYATQTICYPADGSEPTQELSAPYDGNLDPYTPINPIPCDPIAVGADPEPYCDNGTNFVRYTLALNGEVVTVVDVEPDLETPYTPTGPVTPGVCVLSLDEQILEKLCRIEELLDCPNKCPEINQGESYQFDQNGDPLPFGVSFPYQTDPGQVQDFVTGFNVTDPRGCLALADPTTMVPVRFYFKCHDLVSGNNGSNGFNLQIGDGTSGAQLIAESATNTYDNVSPTNNYGTALAGVGTLVGTTDKADRWVEFNIPLGELLAGLTAQTSAVGSVNSATTEYIGDMIIYAPQADWAALGCEDC